MRARRIIVLGVAAVAAAVTVSLPQRAAAAPGTPMLALQAVRGSDPRIIDTAGRQVLLRGVDVDALGQYYQQYAADPPVVPLTENDFTEMAGLGFNVVRLVLSWSRLEPTPGAFNQSYVNQISQAVNWAAANGIYVVLDMHQDAWGIGVMGSPTTHCPAGSTAPVGYDGAPAWATFTDNLPRCAVAGTREISLADEAAWQAFYDNQDGIQTQFDDTWARLAAQFAANPDVAGYDLLNEPNPGLTFNETTGGLGDVYGNAVAAIRTAEASVPDGFHHIAFFEPGVEWSALGTTATPRWSFADDANTVFAPHLYGGSLAATSVDQGFADAAGAAKSYGSTVWSGEYGWYGTPASDQADITEFAREQDAHLWGGAWWQWKQACGSPSTIGSFGEALPTETNSLVRLSCSFPLPSSALPSTSALTIPASTERIVGRATVHAAPGEIGTLTSTPATGAFSVTGTAPADTPASGTGCTLAVWIPGTGRPHFTTADLTDLVATRVRGGYDVTACAHGSYRLTLRSRSAPGPACGPALRVGGVTGFDHLRRLVVTLREIASAGSPCAGRLTSVGRDPAAAAFTLRPGQHRRLTLRLRRPAAERAVRPLATGTDVDANPFDRRFAVRPAVR